MLTRLPVADYTRNELISAIADELNVHNNRVTLRENVKGIVIFVVDGIPYSARTTLDGEHLIKGSIRRGTLTTAADDLTKELANELGLKTAQIEITARGAGTVSFIAYRIPYTAKTTPDGKHLIRGTCRRAAAAEFTLKLPAIPNLKLPAATLTKLKADIAALSKKYWPSAFPKELSAIFSKARLVLLDDDDTPWQGILTGAQGRAAWLVAFDAPHVQNGTYPSTNTFFHLQWHKLPSGKFEINGYFS